MPDKVSMTRYNASPKFFGKGRTKFDLSHTVSTTGNTGDLIPVLCEPVVPGSTFSLKTASLTRLETSLHQTLDNAYVEFAYFFVPSRILWKNFDKYQGYNQDAWAQTLDYQKPQIYLGYPVETGDDPGIYQYVLPNSLLGHLMLPSMKVKTEAYPAGGDKEDVRATIEASYPSVDLLPLRAVFKIYNDYFRDTNIQSEIYYDDGDDSINLGDSFIHDNGQIFYPAQDPLKVNRFKDLFSTALPAPQKGDPIMLLNSDTAPVGFVGPVTGTLNGSAGGTLAPGSSIVEGSLSQLKGTLTIGSSSYSNQPVIADLTGVDFSVNDLRIAIALQSMRERDARSGNRLTEKLYGTWHIEANSLELDRAEFLGGKRIPVNMMEVLQTSETGTTVLGSDAGHSKTVDADDSFVRTFTQWGYVIGFVFVRTSRSYSQGIDRRFFAKDVLDEYDPMLDNIGEMPIKKIELQADFDSSTNNHNRMKEAFGYQEAWYWYKERNNRFSGMFQPGIQGSLDTWHYGDDYRDSATGKPLAPTLSWSWLLEDSKRVDRTIAVQAGAALDTFQWMFNIHFEMTNTFEASKYSIPNTFGF